MPERVDLTYLWARTITCPYCGPGAAIAQLAAGGRRNRRPVKARARFPTGFRGSHLFIRNRQIRQGTIGRDGGPRRWHLPLYRLRPRHRRRRNQASGPGGPNGRATFYGRLQETRRKDLEIREAGQRQMGPELPGSSARGRQQRRDSGQAGREAAGVGGAGHGAERELWPYVLRPLKNLWRQQVARPVFTASASVPRHQRGGLPRNARCRPGGGKA